jgi:hypothetical protein
MRQRNLILGVFLAAFVLQLHVMADSARCEELGYADFPYTSGGMTITLKTTGGVSSYSTSWSDCGGTVTTKVGAIWLGYGGAGTITNTFSTTVSSVTYRITASNNGETFTVTTNGGVPSITVDAGCSYSVAGNVLSFTGSDVGAIITVTVATPVTSFTMAHNGAGGGSLVTLGGYTAKEASVPVSGTAMVVLFLLICAAGIICLRGRNPLAGTPA